MCETRRGVVTVPNDPRRSVNLALAEARSDAASRVAVNEQVIAESVRLDGSGSPPVGRGQRDGVPLRLHGDGAGLLGLVEAADVSGRAQRASHLRVALIATCRNCGGRTAARGRCAIALCLSAVVLLRQVNWPCMHGVVFPPSLYSFAGAALVCQLAGVVLVVRDVQFAGKRMDWMGPLVCGA